jgi:hypothetical protein
MRGIVADPDDKLLPRSLSPIKHKIVLNDLNYTHKSLSMCVYLKCQCQLSVTLKQESKSHLHTFYDPFKLHNWAQKCMHASTYKTSA